MKGYRTVSGNKKESTTSTMPDNHREENAITFRPWFFRRHVAHAQADEKNPDAF
jgi:hypothetical protein